MQTQEFIEHLKTLFAGCQVYFDIQEKKIVISKQRTNEERAKEPELEAKFRQYRIRLQELRSAGATDLPEAPPVNIEDIYGDGIYTPNENYFQLMVNKLDEWETRNNKKVENVSSLIEFLQWFSTEEVRLEQEAEVAQENAIEESLLAFANLQIEQSERELAQAKQETEKEWKKLHRNFTLELKEQWENNGFSYWQVEEWIEVGLKPQDSRYASWINDMFQLSPLGYLNYLFTTSADGNDEELRKQYRQYLQIDEEESDEELLLARAISLSLGNKNDEFEENQEVKNILLIGRTGSGKSTLANVLVNKNDEFEEVFKESAGSVSETKNIQTEKFTINISEDGREKVHYLVIDTAGFGDTQLDNKEILKLISGIAKIIRKNGLNQILFVTNGRFTEKEIETYKLLESIIFDKNAPRYTTIVRTGFPEFEDEEACERDREELRAENEEIFKILRASKIIYVENPSMIGRSATINKEIRDESRKRLLTYLATRQDSYYPSDLESLNERIDNYITSEEELKRDLSTKEQKLREQEIELKKEIDEIQKQKSQQLKITGRNFERQTQELQTKNTKKLQTIRQEFEEVHQSRLQKSQAAYDQATNEINATIQNNLTQIRNSYNHVRIGEPICRYGHDSDIQTYNKSGVLIADNTSDFIGHIYCPTCGQTQTNYTLRNATTYTLEEWSSKNAQEAAERTQKMEEAIRVQENKRQEIINRISQERRERDEQSERDLHERERLQQQVFDQERKIDEAKLNRIRQSGENLASSSSQVKENELKRGLAEKQRLLEEHIRQSRARRDASQRNLETYIEQRTNRS